jgi:hypothetical protein
MNSTTKLSVRIPDFDYESLTSERTKIRAILRGNLKDLSQEERKATRKLIEILLKGGEEPEQVHEADHAAAIGMMQQVVELLEGLTKSETLATGWDDDFDSASVAIINLLVKGLDDYLSVERNETDSETDLEVSDPSAAGMGDSLQGDTPQGKEGVSEKDIKDLFTIHEEIGKRTSEEQVLLQVTEQTGDTGAPGWNESSSLLDAPSLISADSKESPKVATQTEEERLTQSKIEQQLDLDGAGLEGLSTPQQWFSLTSDRLTETNSMAQVISKVVVKMNAAGDAASDADTVVADALVRVSTLAAAGDAASDADTVVADALVGVSTLAAAGDAASDADTVVADALVGVSTLAAAGGAASDADTVVA